MVRQDLLNKVCGSLVGGAVGDALGYTVEFDSFEDIRARYGVGGIHDYDMNYSWLDKSVQHDKAQVSDDTQMTLYTAEGLLYALDHNKPLIPTICDAYLYWYAGQMDMPIKKAYPSELASADEINQRRAPGNTCLSALMSIYSGKEAANNSKGCGGIMRIAPIALYGASHCWTLEQTAKLAGEAAEITHLHDLSTLASACAAAIIQLCILNDDCRTHDGFCHIVEQAIECVDSLYHDSKHLAEFKKLVRKALLLYDDQQEDWLIIENQLGGGWVAEETLAIAIFSVARHLHSFEDCVVCAVNHGGDSDSTGAVAGNIIGAILGIDAIPDKYKDSLQSYNLIVSTAQALSK